MPFFHSHWLRRLLVTFLLLSALDAQAAPDRGDGPKPVWPAWLVKLYEPLAGPSGFLISQVRAPRSGHLARHRDPLAEVRQLLRPMDILVLSSKHRLSAHLIPGMFGHAATYVGTERELRALGIWNDPAIRPHQRRIAAGKIMIEADQRGIHQSAFERVMNTDRVVVIRPRASLAQRRASARLLFSHLGTGFDFHMNADDERTLFCTELIQHAMPQLRLPTRTLYGHLLMFPSDIAEASLSGSGGLKFLYYAKGNAKGWARAGRKELMADIASGWQR